MEPSALRTASDGRRFGGKAADLCRALSAGLPVPDGFVLDSDLVKAVVESRATEVLVELARKLPARVAVRSSCVGEDSSHASFAGQYKTLLNVDPSRELARAVSEVWQSAHSSAALAYRERLGLEASSSKMAVLIQAMLPAEVAGVLFTKNPSSGADERVVEASWGLGESVVIGSSHARLFPPGARRRAARDSTRRKRSDFRLLRERRRPTNATPKTEIGRACLSAMELTQLERLATRCESEFSGPRDLEWAFVAGQLFLLQCRAVTR